MSHSPTPVAATAGTTTIAQITIRTATNVDEDWLEQLQALCFGPGRFARAAFRVRERLAIDPSLSLIAEMDGKPVSSVLMTPISLSGKNGYLLGPLATDPAYRGKGAARLLVKDVCDAALLKKGADYVLLVGDPPYYGPLGFVPTVPGAIIFPAPVDPARVLVYSDDTRHAAKLSGAIAAWI